MQALAEIGGQCIRSPILRLGHAEKESLCRVRMDFKRLVRRVSFIAGPEKKQCHYDILDINKNATHSEIKAAFLKKSKETHPDLNPGDPSMHARFVRLNEAYTVLGKHSSRREYDYSLAALLAYQRNIKQQSADISGMPGSGTYRPTNAETEKPFWDETIFEMRDKSQDHSRFYDEDMYYGIKGVRRLSNTSIVLGCFVVMALGVVLHLGAVQYSKRVVRNYMDERDKKAFAHLDAVRRRARENGKLKQLKLLTASQRKKEAGNSPSSSDT